MIMALWLSKPLRWAVCALLAFGTYEAWKYNQRAIGAAQVTQQIEKKADENAKVAEEVRAAVEVASPPIVTSPGKRVRGPYERRNSSNQ